MFQTTNQWEFGTSMAATGSSDTFHHVISHLRTPQGTTSGIVGLAVQHGTLSQKAETMVISWEFHETKWQKYVTLWNVVGYLMGFNGF